ncbi:MAG: oligosaccharide flippase family protein [Myxococcaceae bacterium]|nr:oligosaccharide flippase family protein [Myxococcaceae bacterium]
MPQLVNFLLVPVYSHYMDPAEMGILDIALSTQLLLTILMRLGLPGAVGRLYFDEKEGSAGLRSLISTVVWLSLVSTVAVAIVALLVGPTIFETWLPDVPFSPYIPLAIAGAALMGAPEIQRRLLQAREQSAASARLSAMLGVLSTVLTATLVVGFGLGARGVLWASIGVGVVFAYVAYRNHKDDLSGAFSTKQARASLSYGLPIVPHHGAAWVQQNLGRFFLGAVGNAASVGLLGVATRIVSPLTVVTGAFASAYSPVYFSWRTNLSPEAALEEARHVAAVVAVLGSIAVMGAGTAGAWVMRHVLAESFQQGAPVVGLVAAAAYIHLLYTLITVELFHTKRTQWISAIFIFSAVLNAATMGWTIEHWGLIGAAASQLAGGVLSLALVSWMSTQSFPLPLKVRPMLAGLLVAGAGAAWPIRTPTGGPVREFLEGIVALVAMSAIGLVASGQARRVVDDFQTVVLQRIRKRLKKTSQESVPS